MPTPTYERLPQDGDYHDPGPSHVEQPHPSKYYDDSSFNAPNSDDEADQLLEKNGLRSPGTVELGPLDVEEDEGEVFPIRGQDQRRSSLRLLIYSLVVLVLLAGAVIYFNAKNWG